MGSLDGGGREARSSSGGLEEIDQVFEASEVRVDGRGDGESKTSR